MSKVFKERSAFNFYRSYYDVYLLLDSEAKLEFIESIFTAQFQGKIVEPNNPIALLAFRSQLHAITKQIQGFEKGKETYPTGNPTKGKYKGTHKGSGKGKGKGQYKEVQVQEKEKVQEEIYIKFDHLELTKKEFEKLLLTYSKEQIDDMINRVQNYKGNSKYKSLYLTLNTWLNRDKKRNEEQKAKDYGIEKPDPYLLTSDVLHMIISTENDFTRQMKAEYGLTKEEFREIYNKKNRIN